MNNSLLGLVCVLTLATSSAAQHTWIVDLANRPGTDFLDLPAAVAAASPGDTLQVRFVAGQNYTAPVIDRSLLILGDALQSPTVLGSIEVRSIPAGATLLLRDIKNGTSGVSGPGVVRGIYCHDNQGHLEFENLGYGISPTQAIGGSTDIHGVTFERCALVTISHSMIWASILRTTVVDSTVVATDTYFGESSPLTSPVASLETMFVQRSNLYLVDCTVIGGDGGLPNIYGLAAIMACDSHIRLAGSCDIQGGYLYQSGIQNFGIDVDGACWPPAGHPAPIVDLDPHGIVSGYWPPPIQITNIGPVPAVRWDLSPTQASLAATQYSAPSSLTILVASNVASVPVLTGIGPVFLDPSSLFVVDIGAASAAGVRNWSIAIPPGIPPGTSIALQALHLDTNGNLALTNVVTPSVY